MHRVLLSLTRKRPRDLVKLFYGAARSAYRNKHEKIKTVDLQSTFEAYSGERLQDIINEFKTELPSIANLLYGMKPTTREKRTPTYYLFTNDALINKIKNIVGQHRLVFANGAPATPKLIAEFLYKIDFITARKELDGVIVRRFYDQNRILQSQFADFGFQWEVHPAYRWALQPGDEMSIFEQLDLEGEVRSSRG